MILTDDEIRKAAEFAAAQMWPESGYVGWTEDDAVFHRKFIEACLEKLRGGVELPAPTARFNWNLGKFEWLVTFKRSEHHLKPLYSHDQLLQYGAAQRLAGREQAIEEWRVHLLALWEKGDFDLKDALAASPQPAAQEPTSAVPVVEQMVAGFKRTIFAMEFYQWNWRTSDLMKRDACKDAMAAIAAGQKFIKESGK